MRGLIEHLVLPIVEFPDDVSINVIEGEATVLLELKLNEKDKEALIDEDDRTLRAIRQVLSAAAGRRKASLELVDEFSEPEEDEEEDDADDDGDDVSEEVDDA